MGKRHWNNRVATAENGMEHLEFTGKEGTFFLFFFVSFGCWIASWLLIILQSEINQMVLMVNKLSITELNKD